MENFSSYEFIIEASLLVIVSYAFNKLSKRTSVPSVLMLIILGIGLNEIIHIFGYENVNFFPALQVLGVVGLILIVLEAAIDLELKKEKKGIITRAFLSAFVAIVLNMFIIGIVLYFSLNIDFSKSLLYATPLSIISSAIVLPSITSLSQQRKEFLIYESTFSDILGIMIFYFVLGQIESDGNSQMIIKSLISISITVVVSFLVGYVLIFIFKRLEGEAKIFLLIASLMLLYSVSKLMHLSSLLIILVFGLMLKNKTIFFRGKLSKLVQDRAFDEIFDNIKLITVETSFVVRTFFFVVFGLTISLASLLNIKIILISLVILVIIFAVRFALLKLIHSEAKQIEYFTAPRGLITILLYYSIPDELLTDKYDSGILLLIILLSGTVMTYALIANKLKNRHKNIDSVKIISKDEVQE